MPRLFSTTTAIIIGYLDGAGLGALLADVLAGHGDDAKIALVAVFLTGPLGALLGLLLAQMAQTDAPEKGATRAPSLRGQA